VSIPDVFVPACVTPGTVSLLVVHNHPSGDPTPSLDDVALTVRLESAAAVLDFSFVDHLIVGENQRYYSFRAAGRLGVTPTDR
jgi:DNA repair protein RadC